ncbi:L-2-hydroxyglutarate oxidase [Geothermobacter hydrogeniphilus]|uniref:Hydroxyglutarate oxidase n=1 Tax=Geothermobacter hydrogeniphilus TaxID=1969733 RepID=A0A1X0XMW5_9BACT|nr:L-2-hydroxyglutarate oxidase [Geothermobacter hydrogeniphilus]ORJ54262.1 hydroxyglutarate oxidase [Geothermobacter hydrogeniphilus]
MRPDCTLVVIGGGIVGLATARKLLEVRPGLRLQVLEKDAEVACQQTGHNSGVIHSGLYYRPGSLKARLCGEGREALYDYCRRREIPFERCGKLVVALDAEEVQRLEALQRRGEANGLEGLQWLDKAGLKRYEPHVAGISGLWVPQTGVVDYRRVAAALAEDIEAAGGEVVTGCRVGRIRPAGDGFFLETSRGRRRCRYLVNCAGLQSDLVARRAGLDPAVRIVPFRGEYYHLGERGAGLVRHLIYPVPNPDLPFLGVHFTRGIDGRVEAGPNAVLAFKREGYRRCDVSPIDLLQTLSYPGFWKMAAGFWRIGIAECHRSLSRQAFLADLQRLLPDLNAADLRDWGSGVRAQAVDRHGTLVDDFVIASAPGMIHVLNAPSPAATAALAIAGEIVRRAQEEFGL